MTNLNGVLKSTDITLLTKVCLVKAMVFPVVMYGYKNWTIKKTAEKLMFLTCHAGEDSSESLGLQGDPSQSILKEINPEYSLEGLMLQLQYFGLLM